MRKRDISLSNLLHFEQNTSPQFRQWCLRSYIVKRTLHEAQKSAPSSLSQWSAARPGISHTLQENTRPLVSPTYTLRWSLKWKKTILLRFTKNQSGKLLGGRQSCYRRRFCVVFTIVSGVHCQFTPEHQLPLPFKA